MAGAAKPNNRLRRLAAIVITFVVLIGLVTGYYMTRPMWDAKHFKWTAGPGPSLSITAYANTFGAGGKPVDPTLRITCAHDQPNLELEPIVTSYCAGDCSSGGSVQLQESFRTHPFAKGSLTFVNASDKYTQDLLSDPANIKPSAIGLGQLSAWWMGPQSLVATRFDYNFEAKSNAAVYQQARNYIERIAASKDLELETGTSSARFDARDLKGKLPAFWASCPAPN